MHIKKKKVLEEISMGVKKMQMDLRELQEAMRKTGADPTTIFYAKANGTLEFARGGGL